MHKQNCEDTAIVLIVGYRWAGKSLLLHHLEASGYCCVDNLPVSLVRSYLSVTRGKDAPGRKLFALALKPTPGEEDSLVQIREELKSEGLSAAIVFLSASDSTLEERRGASQATGSAEDDPEGRDAERAALAPVKEKADLVLDSSYASPTDERDRVIALAEGGNRRVRTLVELSSFGFKYGAPAGDLVLDVRFIPNPYYVAALRPLTGKDRACSEYVLGDESAASALKALAALVESMVPAYEAQGKPVLRVRIGCTGGQHRSVAIVEALGAALADKGYEVALRHRELQNRPSRTAHQTN